MNDTVSASDPIATRQHWMSVLARAPAEAIEAALIRVGPLPAWTRVRGPETGLVMVRGRAGGSGSPFNLGEMTVTRCTVRVESGVAGHAYIAGRDERRAELAAVADAVLQDPTLSHLSRDSLIRPLAEAQQEQRLNSRGESGGHEGGILRHAEHAVMTVGLEAGFADPVADAQRCFRAVLDAMAHPGRVARVTGVAAPFPLGTAAAAVVLSLVDHETPLWLDPDVTAARQWIEFHCGTAVVADSAACRFALALALPDLRRLPSGSHESPETSATVVCQVASLATGKAWRLSGPGLREPAVVAIDGLPRDFATIWRRNHMLFPRGIDLILCAGDQLTALPRTVAIEEA